MPKKSNRTIITNRQLNFTLSPVDLHNPKEIPYSLSNYAIDGTWNQHQSILLDVILDRIFKGYYAKYENIPKSWRSPSVIEVNQNFVGILFHPVILKYLSGKPIEAFSMREGYDVVAIQRNHYDSMSDDESKKGSFEEHFEDFLKSDPKFQSFIAEMNQAGSSFSGDVLISLSIENLFKNYPVLRQRKYRYNLQERVQEIANTKFKMSCKVKCLVKAPEYNEKGRRIHAGERIDAFYEMHDFQQIFSVDFDQGRFVLNFKSPLGKMILHNMLLLDTDWISEEVFELGKNAFFIYKRFILNRISGRNPPDEIELWFEDIKKFLDLKGKNKSGIYSILDQALIEMRDKGLIKDFNWNKSYVKQRQYKLYFDHPKASRGKQASKKNS